MIRILFISLLSLFPLLLWAEDDAGPRHSLVYTLTTEGAAGSGDHTAYYLTANRHGILSTNPNTGYLRAALTYRHTRGQWDLETAFDLLAQTHAYSSFYLQQLYAQVTRSWLSLGVGTREFAPLLRDQRLGSGSTIWSGNSRPIPQAYLRTPDFITIPGTKGRMQFYFDICYGKLLDDNYKEDRYARYSAGRSLLDASFLTTDVWYHQKKLHLRTNPDRHLVFYVGFDHVAYFGGKSYNSSFQGETQRFNPRLKDFFKVLLTTAGDGNSPMGDRVFFYGSHLGAECFKFDYQWGGLDKKEHRLGIYFENIFEDGSSIAKFNGMDGLWGIEYHNLRPYALVSGAVIEYFQTSNQSGPIHWDREDWSEAYGEGFGEGRSQGADDYYNNYYYAGHSYYGLAIGSPLIKSPVYNADGYLRFTDNRIRAFHVAVEGTLARFAQGASAYPIPLGYRLLASYRRSWGTSYVPSSSIRDALCTMVELNANRGPWSAKVAYALDNGDLLGNNQSFNFSISYHGKIL